MPAILKGFIDRVFALGFAYSYKKGECRAISKEKQHGLLQPIILISHSLKRVHVLEPFETTQL